MCKNRERWASRCFQKRSPFGRSWEGEEDAAETEKITKCFSEEEREVRWILANYRC